MYETATQYSAGNDDTLLAYPRRSIAASSARCQREELANCETASTPSLALPPSTFTCTTPYTCACPFSI